MTLLFRFFRVIIRALFGRRRLGPLDESTMTFRVWPADLDLNIHMNNARYNALMDAARLDFFIRNGVMRLAWRRRWRPTLGGISIKFRRSLGLFQKYRIRTRIVCWDEKWFYMEQRFERRSSVVAVALVKGLLRGRAGNVPISDVMHALGASPVSPPLPLFVERWKQSDAVLGKG